MRKEQLRKEILARRNALSIAEVRANSTSICTRLKPYLKKVNGIYLAYETEVDVTSLCQEKFLTFAIPKTFDDHTIRFYPYDALTVLEKSAYGIWEPRDGKELQNLDVLVIPLVAFDVHCNRLGHGGGFYDRYLQHYQGLRIGVAHECQKVKDIDPQPHDIPLDIILTEKTIYKK